MQDIFGSVRRSLVFRPNDETASVSTPSPAAVLADKINSCIRKSRVFSKQFSPIKENSNGSANNTNDSNPRHLIRWRKGELIGCGAFGQVYMGMNLDSGELLAVKQVLITTNSASMEKAQAHLKELEEEVKLLKNLSHPNIVRYLGTVREEDTLNILLEFVPGGSISSLLGKFGAFPETVIRSFTKQLLLGLEYLHKNGIMHRDIKGANILVDNKGCIKLADFGASKQVVELATVTGAKSMKGTPYWMAPEVILQTGHSFSADIWSVGCTVIEMATGKPPWSQQYQEVAALFHIGTTKAHPPIPEHLSTEAQNFLLKCLQKEPNLRPPASELLQHPFVTGDRDSSAQPASVMDIAEISSSACATNLGNPRILCLPGSSVVCELDNVSPSFMSPDNSTRPIWRRSNGEDDMCLIDDNYDFGVRQPNCDSVPDKCFNSMCELNDGSSGSLNLDHGVINLEPDQSVHRPDGCSGGLLDKDNDYFSPCGQSLSEDDEVLTESKIRAFLDDKALELKKMQTPLYEEFYNTLNGVGSPSSAERTRAEGSNYLKLPPKSRSPSRGTVGNPSVVDTATTTTPSSSKRRLSEIGITSDQSSPDIPSSQEDGSSMSFSEIQRKWKEELDQELERQRELMRQATGGQNSSSPKDRALNRQREKSRFASP